MENNSDFEYENFDWQSMLNRLEKTYHNDFFIIEVILTVVLTTISLLGTIGNSFVILVFQQHAKKSSSNFFVVALGSIDLLICTFCIPTSLIIEVWRFPTYDIICKLLNWFRCYLIIFSPILLVLIATDRCLLICFVPSKQIKVKLAPRLLIIMFFVSTCLSLPSGLISGTYIRMNDSYVPMNMTPQMRSLNDLMKKSKTLTSSCHIDERIINAKQFNIYRYFVMSLFFTILSGLILLYMSIFVFIIFQHNQWRRHGRTASENKVINPLHPKNETGFDSSLTSSLKYQSNSQNQKSKNSTFSFEISNLLRGPKHSKTKANPSSYASYSSLKLVTAVGVAVQCESIKNDHVSTMTTSQITKPTMRKLSRSNKTLKTLLLVSLSFILSFIPYLLVSTGLLFAFGDKLSYNEKVIKYLLYYSYNLNSLLNPLIYACMNNSFQKELKKLTTFKCRCYFNF